jgi:predicted lipoprotein with Yx(FWY)xxD motif
MKKSAFVLSVFISASLFGCASMAAGPAPAVASNGVLTDANGMTLYTFDRDTAASGTSACVDKCAANWPALPAQATDQASGDFSIITRADGTRQWAFKGKPLYRWIKDQKAGDRTGDGVNQVWHVARP